MTLKFRNSILVIVGLIICVWEIQLVSGLKCFDCQYIKNGKKKADSGVIECENHPTNLYLTEFPDFVTSGSGSNPASDSNPLSKKSCLFQNILNVAMTNDGKDSQELSPAVRRLINHDATKDAFAYCMTLSGKFEGLDLVFRGISYVDIFQGDTFCLDVPQKLVEGFENARICGCSKDECNGGKINS